jgi:cysteine-rich repeat protein
MSSSWKWLGIVAVMLATPACNNLLNAGDPQIVDDPGGDQDGDPPPPKEGPVCGDGVVEGDEQCDDGNDEPSDGCDACLAGCGPFPEVLDTASGHCFLFELVQAKSWNAAEAACEAWDGKLAAINSIDELGFAQQHLEANTWVGGRDPGGPGPLEWVTGEPWTLDVNATFVTEPVPYEHDTCLLIDGDLLGFRQEDCSKSVGYICEKAFADVE